MNFSFWPLLWFGGATPDPTAGKPAFWHGHAAWMSFPIEKTSVCKASGWFSCPILVIVSRESCAAAAAAPAAAPAAALLLLLLLLLRLSPLSH